MFGKRNNDKKEILNTATSKRIMRDILPPARGAGRDVMPPSPEIVRRELELKINNSESKSTGISRGLKQTGQPHAILRKRKNIAGKVGRKIIEIFKHLGSAVMRPFSYFYGTIVRFIGGKRKISSYSEPSFTDIGVKNKNKKAVIVMGTALMLILFSFAVYRFSYVVIKITPRQEFVSVELLLKGSLENAERDIPLEAIAFQKSKEASAPVSGTKEANQKASGRVVIYNAYSSDPQVLVRRTRLETPDGKIYRIPETITVPGAQVIDGKIVPSSIEVDIVADRAGEEYNIGLSDFSIPGFKGTARYAKFYARSKTPIEGGFVGVKQVASDEDINNLKNMLKEQIQEEIFTEYKKHAPENLVLLEGAYEISYLEDKESTTSGQEGGEASVRLSGEFKGLLFKKESISEALSRAYANDLSSGVRIENFDTLKDNMLIEKIDFESGEMAVKIKGEAHMVWNFDEEKLKQDFIASGRNLAAIFGVHDAILRADVEFKPSWWRIIPKDMSRIEIEEILER